MNFLEQIKQQPQHVKGKYAFIIATLITGIITVMWSVSLPARFVHVGEGIHRVTDGNQANVLDSVIQEVGLEGNGSVVSDTYESGAPTLDEALYRSAYGEAPPTVSEEQMIPVNGFEETEQPPIPVAPTVESVGVSKYDVPSNITFESPPTPVGSDILIPKAD